MKPIMIDLYCGLGGWAQGGLAEGYYVIGFDIERHDYGTGGYPAQLVLQDALTIHGKQFKDAALIVASPPCQEYSYMAMPWSRAKAIEAEYKSGVRDVKNLTALFDACFRIQREAIEAAGHFIPLVVENVRGAQKWVGRSRWNYGSYHLWGDVPALMPMTKAVKVSGLNWNGSDKPGYIAQGFNTTAEQRLRDDMKNNGGSWFGIDPRGNRVEPNYARDDCKVPGFRCDGSGKSFQTASVKTVGHVNQHDGYSHTRHLTNRAESDHIKQSGISGVRDNGKGNRWFQDGMAQAGSKSKARKAASAAIAKIPFALARHIAAYWAPREAYMSIAR